MVERFLRLKDDLDMAFQNIKNLQDFEFTKRDWSALKEIKTILQPVAEAISLLEGDQYPTLSFVLELRHLLLHHAEASEVSHSTAQEFKDSLHEALLERFEVEKMPEVVQMATLLDPNTRDAPFLKPNQIKNAWQLIKLEMGRLQPQVVPTADPEVTELTALAKLRIDLYKSRTKPDELRQYKALPLSNVKIGALDWWSSHAEEFPVLSMVARKILAIPASSAPVERLFSTAGNVITKKRMRLTPSATQAQVLLYQNKHIK